MVRALLVPTSHADSDDRCAAHRKHGGDCHNESDKGHGNIDCTQRSRADALPDENAVHHIVEIGYK